MMIVRQLIRFGGVGVASTLVSLLLYTGLRSTVDTQTANLVATVVVGLANAVANQRLTFAVPGTRQGWRHLGPSLALQGLGLAISAVCLAALASADPNPARATELAVVVVASLAGGLLRFSVLNVLSRDRATAVSGPSTQPSPVGRLMPAMRAVGD